ncbi:heavy-metal-associated domain-containing protein [Companilactobacillus sp.]|jgi:copper chaperone CopZ|uniref:heavy-metal-associated domain-containing protein n=1 Tax=Companilactobacillus sp. TaxID=2767905 RepID=UPI0025BC4A18|nr:heavy metal-associated domain-containing protein [Companilactobacillus sp.]MCH4009258.1 heavy-metal-associated domain-containing protein [Companilactobacillus sp.]MCH4050563.1 heavy-metal-associated domain-containing protein [Companilactobacillus sp.]MCH4077200.1 heavy-metal-associated domain-containing protein [Companilactobacillus sp.]MCH4125776.1 heavy-metal-associated domain-containing protein [Companilactobacillus sp.]MCI1311485.1 heavy-metal-associated domain-containing protein [Compa
MAKKILISGLRCEKCPVHIAQRLSDVDGVDRIEKNMDNMTATVIGNADVDVVRELLSDKPFKVEELD